MPMMSRTTIQCSRCGSPVEAMVESLIDPAQDPESKIRLLSGRLNTAQCSRCGNVTMIAAPLVYHDASKELLISFMPMELGMPKDRQERVIGDLLRDVTSRIPKEQFKGYLFQPRNALTMQGLIDQVLQADGVTPEMMEQQRAMMRLVETFLQTSEEDLPNLVQLHDERINPQFFQMLTITAQRMIQEGRPDMAQHVLLLQQRVAELSSYGQELIAQNAAQEQIVRDVAQDVRALGTNAQRTDFLDLAIGYANDEQKIQALVGLVRPAFDAQFFQELTLRTAQAPAAERDSLETLGEQLQQFTEVIDQQTQMAVQESAEFLQALLSQPNPDELIRANAAMIDDTFMAVLTANIQEAERRSDIQMSGRLKALYNKIVGILRENMQPELRFINELLSAPSEDDARAMIAEQAETYGPRLLEMMDAVEEILASRGDTVILSRLAFIREATQQVFS